MHNSTQTPLISPKELKKMYPLKDAELQHLQAIQKGLQRIFIKEDHRLLVILGPCSVHDEESFLHFSQLFKNLATTVQKHIVLVLRFFCEKSRTSLGWRGFLQDPYLDGSYELEEGIIRSRKMLLHLIKNQIPCAMEFVDPLVLPYLDDIICWGFIGARTSASQPHRLHCSSLSIPVGFKNSLDGTFEEAVQGILTARSPHSYIGIDESGKVSAVQTLGNPYTHLVLRGGKTKSNYDLKTIASAKKMIKDVGVCPKIVIDCSHGNCQKDLHLQKQAFSKGIEYFLSSDNDYLLGMMLESFLYAGKQLLSENLSYGVSVTDPCLDWETTHQLIMDAYEQLATAYQSKLGTILIG